MSTNREVVTDALREISVLDADESASVEDAMLALRELNRLMSSLTADGIDLGFPPQDSLSDEFPLDEVAEAQIIVLLAARLTKHFRVSQPSPVLAIDVDAAKSQLLRAAVLTNMQESSLTHMPLGENTAGFWDISTGS